MQRQGSCFSGGLRIITLSILACWLFGVSPAACQNTSSIEGQVRADYGRVIPFGVTVRLETIEGMIESEQPANSAGYFEFENLLKIAYRLIVTAEGFQPAERDIDLAYSANRVIVNLFLSPVNKTRPLLSVLTTLTDMRAPEKARKEYEKGVRALASKNVQEARAHFENAVADYSCYARAQTDLALTLSTQHEYSRAEAALKKAIECDQGFLDAYLQLGQIFNAQKKYGESETLLQQGRRHSASAWQFHYQLGVAHYGLRQYDKAEEDYLKVQSLNATPPPELHVKLADVYLKRGKYEKAYHEMQSYLRAEPGGRFATKVKNIMQQMESDGILSAAKGPPTTPQPPKP